MSFPNESYQTSFIKLKKIKRRKFIIFSSIIFLVILTGLITYLIIRYKNSINPSDIWLDDNQMDQINKQILANYPTVNFTQINSYTLSKDILSAGNLKSSGLLN